MGSDTLPELIDVGLPWRTEVCQQVFEEAAIDCGQALKAWSDSRDGERKGRRVGFPQFKRKVGSGQSFRLRNKQRAGRRPAIRVGDNGLPRSVTLPGLGSLRVHDDTRRIRRMLTNGRAHILFATLSRRDGRWWVSLNVEAESFHPSSRHAGRLHDDHTGWVGVDRGLSTFVVAATADGTEVLRVECAPKTLVRGAQRQRHLAKSLSRKGKETKNRRDAAARLARHHFRIGNVRRNFIHAASNRRPNISMPMRSPSRSRRQCGGQSRTVGGDVPSFCTQPGPPSSGPGHQRPRTAQRWPASTCWWNCGG